VVANSDSLAERDTSAKGRVVMRIGTQKARKITNIENRTGHVQGPEMQELLALVRELVAEGCLDRRQAAELEDAVDEAGQAAEEEGAQSSRFRRAMENLKHAAGGATVASSEVVYGSLAGERRGVVK
jgi:hypothetical protein